MNSTSKRPIIVASIIVITDLIIKTIIFRIYEFGQWTELFGGLVTVGRVHNVGMAFGIRFGINPLEIAGYCFQIVFVFFAVRVLWSSVRPLFKYATAFILGSWIDNYADRLLFAQDDHYLSMSYITVNNGAMISLADILSTIGWVLLIAAILIDFKGFRSIFSRQKSVA